MHRVILGSWGQVELYIRNKALMIAQGVTLSWAHLARAPSLSAFLDLYWLTIECAFWLALSKHSDLASPSTQSSVCQASSKPFPCSQRWYCHCQTLLKLHSRYRLPWSFHRDVTWTGQPRLYLCLPEVPCHTRSVLSSWKVETIPQEEQI